MPYAPSPAWLPLAAILWSAPVFAAEVTEMPPQLRGDIEITYAGGFTSGGLEEADEIRARQRIVRHDVGIGAEFAPADGIALRIGVPITPSYKMSWSDASRMTFDPVTGTGTYVGADPLDEPPTIRASGLEGIWLGAAVAPFSERYELSQQVTWRLEVAYRTASSKTFWTADGDSRGIAPGGSAWMFAAAFSTDRGIASPYLAFATVLESSVTTDVVDSEGNTVATGLEVAPPSSVDLTGGIEVLSSSNEETGQRFAFDLFMGFGYRTWGDVPSGIFLPSVLDQSKTIVVTRGEHLIGKAGLGFVYDINTYVGLRLGAEGRYRMPYAPEHVYPQIRTSLDSFEFVGSAEIEGRIR